MRSDPDARTGIAALMAVPDVSLVAAPDDVVAPEVATALLDRCDAARDRMAIVNTALNAADLATIAQHRGTAFGALYYPRLHVPAPHLTCGYAVVPPCGHVAGVLAKAAFASGPHLPPKLAGLIADNHPCRVGPLDRPVTAADAEWLVPRGVNCTATPPPDNQESVLVWGARTMTKDPQWKYVNVRRLFLYIEESIERGHPVGGLRAERRAALVARIRPADQLPDSTVEERRLHGDHRRPRRSTSRVNLER